MKFLLFQRNPGSLKKMARGFSLVEVMVASSILAVGFSSILITVLQAGRMTSAAEEEALVATALEQRIDQFRDLSWDQLTSASGLTSNVWTDRPDAADSIPFTQETVTISAFDISDAKSLTGTWNAGATPTATMSSSGTKALSEASCVRVSTTITWTSQFSQRPITRSIITMITRGGISKSEV